MHQLHAILPSLIGECRTDVAGVSNFLMLIIAIGQMPAQQQALTSRFSPATS